MATSNTRHTHFRYSGDIPNCPKYHGLANTCMGIAENNNKYNSSFVWHRKFSNGVEIRVQKTISEDRIIYIYVPLISVIESFRLIFEVPNVLIPSNINAVKVFYPVTPSTSKNYLKPLISKNKHSSNWFATSRTWSDINSKGKIIRQITTIFNDLDNGTSFEGAEDFGLTHDIDIFADGIQIGYIPKISYLNETDDVHREAVSPAFITENNKLAVITITNENVQDENSPGRWITRWILPENSNQEVPELVRDITIDIGAAWPPSHHISLNKDATQAAVMLGDQGFIITDINKILFNPSSIQVTNFTYENPAYSLIKYKGTGIYSYDLTTTNLRLCWKISHCDIAGLDYWDIIKEIDNTNSRGTKKENTTVVDSNKLIAFGYDILLDKINILVYKPLYRSYVSIRDYTRIRDLNTTYGFNTTIENEHFQHQDIINEDKTLNITQLKKHGFAISQVVDTSIMLTSSDWSFISTTSLNYEYSYKRNDASTQIYSQDGLNDSYISSSDYTFDLISPSTGMLDVIDICSQVFLIYENNTYLTKDSRHEEYNILYIDNSKNIVKNLYIDNTYSDYNYVEPGISYGVKSAVIETDLSSGIVSVSTPCPTNDAACDALPCRTAEDAADCIIGFTYGTTSDYKDLQFHTLKEEWTYS